MDRSQIKQNTSENKSVEYAGFWIRVLAALIDGIILGIIGGVIQLVIVFSGFLQAFNAAYWTLFYEHLAAKEGW